jgi:hypothetical protein
MHTAADCVARIARLSQAQGEGQERSVEGARNLQQQLQNQPAAWCVGREDCKDCEVGGEGLKPRWRGLGLGAGSRGLGAGVAAASTGAWPEASPTTTPRLPENRAKPLCARGERRRVVGHNYQ